MTSEPELLRKLSGINQSAAFNRWAASRFAAQLLGALTSEWSVVLSTDNIRIFCMWDWSRR
jgi:hypothetical protein